MSDRIAVPTQLLDLLDEPWAIRASALRTFLSWVNAGSIPVTALTELAATASPSSGRQTGGTAVLPISGPITRRPTALSFLCGGASIEQISAQLQDALADPSVSKIVLQVDSPGGTVDGVPELAAEIYAARAKKPITALVDTTAASAAYWLASQANEIVVAPSGSVGSIGVFGLHMDQSRALDAAGITPTFIHAGKYKVEENPLQPLSDDAKAAMQSRIDAFYGMFVHDVARGRGISVAQVRSDFGEGRMVMAKDAVTKGMADRVSGSSSRSANAEAPTVDINALVAVAHATAARSENLTK